MNTFVPSADAEIPLPRLRSISQLWTCAAVLAACGAVALGVDVPLAAWVQGGQCPSVVLQVCSLGEVFGHGLGVALIVLAMGVLDPAHRYVIPRILAASLGSGIVANVLKLLVARCRPFRFDLLSDAPESFVGWFPLLRNNSWEQSFPSSHAATAAGLAIVLAYYYPRGRWLFPLFAALAGFQRVIDMRHFLSDVFWGAAVGCTFAPLCVYGSRISREFDKLERRLQGDPSRTNGRLSHVAPRSGLPNEIKGIDRSHAA